MSISASNRFPDSKITTGVGSFDRTDAAMESAPPFKRADHKTPLIMKFPIELGSNEYPNVLQFRIFYRSENKTTASDIQEEDKVIAEKNTSIADSEKTQAQFKEKQTEAVRVLAGASSAASLQQQEKAEAMNKFYKTPQGYAASHPPKGATTSIEQQIRAQELEQAYIFSGNQLPDLPPIYENDSSINRDWKDLPGGGNTLTNINDTANVKARQEQIKNDNQIRAANVAQSQAAQEEFIIAQNINEQQVADLKAFQAKYPPGTKYTAGDPLAPKQPGPVPELPYTVIKASDIPRLGSGTSPADVEFNLKNKDQENIISHAEKAIATENRNKETYQQTIKDIKQYKTRRGSGSTASGSPITTLNAYDQMVSIYLPYCAKINNEEIFTYDNASFDILGADSAFQGGVAAAANALGSMLPEQLVNAAKINKGQIVNPRLQLLFKSKEIRTFNFTWELYPRNKDETNMIRDIVQQFRSFSSPSLKQADIGLLAVPGEFEVRFLNKNSTTTGFVENEWLPRILRFAINSISVDYSPQGIWGSFVDNSPLGVVLTMQISELYVVDKEKVEEGY